MRLKDATEFPKFCPNCGGRRQQQLIEPDAVGYVFVTSSPIDVETFGQPLLNGDLAAASPNAEWVTIANCTRCGFNWQSVQDPSSAISRRLHQLSGTELGHVMQFMYPVFHNMISTVATRTGKSIGHVQRVLTKEKTSALVLAALVAEFRSRLAASGVDKLV